MALISVVLFSLFFFFFKINLWCITNEHLKTVLGVNGNIYLNNKKMLNKILPRQQNVVKHLKLFFKILAKNSPKNRIMDRIIFIFHSCVKFCTQKKRLVFMYFTSLLFGDLIVHICIPSSFFFKFFQLLRFPPSLYFFHP